MILHYKEKDYFQNVIHHLNDIPRLPGIVANYSLSTAINIQIGKWLI